MNNILNIIKFEFPDKAIDISESLQLLKETISSTIDDISFELNKALISRDKSKMDKYNSLATEVFRYEEMIEKVISLLEMGKKEYIDEMENVASSIKEQQQIPNYSDYLVDNQIEHSLLEDFKHKRPFGFKFISDEIIETKTWKEVFWKTCEIVYDIDSKKFNSFEELRHMNGKRNKYFSKNKNKLRDPYLVGDDIFVETNHSANTLKDLIIKILQEFNLKVSDYKVYFMADYTELNKNNK